jgi:hypothetical protein
MVIQSLQRMLGQNGDGIRSRSYTKFITGILTLAISTSNEAKIIAAANACSAAIYDPDKQPTVPGLEFQRLSYLNPSKAGLAKATGIWEVQQARNDNQDGSLLIIAVRGTSGVLDAIVNLNGEQRDTGALLVSLAVYFRGLNGR